MRDIYRNFCCVSVGCLYSVVDVKTFTHVLGYVFGAGEILEDSGSGSVVCRGLSCVFLLEGYLGLREVLLRGAYHRRYC